MFSYMTQIGWEMDATLNHVNMLDRVFNNLD